MKYTAIEGMSVEMLIEEVNKSIGEGLEPLGAPVHVPASIIMPEHWVQFMTKN